jgi:transcriptional regulator with XRE-family HTH domain
MKTLADRIQWILDQKHMSQRQLSLRAGLTPGHLGVILHRVKSQDSETGRIASETIEKLAKAAGVSAAWLGTGEGRPTLPPTLRERTQWAMVRNAAKQMDHNTPSKYFDEVGEFRVGGDFDAQFITVCAKELRAMRIRLGTVSLKDRKAMDLSRIFGSTGDPAVKHQLTKFRDTLQNKEAVVFDMRLVAKDPMTLQQLADKFGVPQERVRQLEERILDKLRDYLADASLADL